MIVAERDVFGVLKSLKFTGADLGLFLKFMHDEMRDGMKYKDLAKKLCKELYDVNCGETRKIHFMKKHKEIVKVKLQMEECE